MKVSSKIGISDEMAAVEQDDREPWGQKARQQLNVAIMQENQRGIITIAIANADLYCLAIIIIMI